MNLIQNNDIYIYIAKNKSYKETEIIRNIILDNFVINSTPQKGNIVIYRPSSSEEENYEYSEEYIVEDSLIYEGDESASFKELKVSNQGGVISFRYVNENLRNILIR